MVNLEFTSSINWQMQKKYIWVLMPHFYFLIPLFFPNSKRVILHRLLHINWYWYWEWHNLWSSSKNTSLSSWMIRWVSAFIFCLKVTSLASIALNYGYSFHFCIHVPFIDRLTLINPLALCQFRSIWTAIWIIAWLCEFTWGFVDSHSYNSSLWFHENINMLAQQVSV